MRGCARNVDSTKEIVDKTLENFDYISQITFTGGEPTLNSELIIYAIDKIMKLGIGVSGFYIVTNGSTYSPELLCKLLEFYAYCDEKEACGICVSVDGYHDGNYYDAYNIYSGVKFFRQDKEHKNFWDGSIINRGNAKEYGIGTYDLPVQQFNPEYAEVDYGIIRYDGIVYVNSKGNVFFDCDLSYEMQDEIESINVLEESIGKMMFKEMLNTGCLSYELSEEELELVQA